MKKLFTLLPLLGLSFFAYSAHHESGEHDKKMFENNFAYLSTYTIPAGSNPSVLEKSLLKNVKELEEDGYNVCGLYRHSFGGDRAFYSFCYFDSWEQFAEINDKPGAGDVRQLYGDHSDNLVAIVEKNLTKKTPNVLMASYSFGPYLTDNEKRTNAKVLFDAYDKSFGGCNMMEHFWGSEQAWYFTCGFNSYADFTKKVKTLSGIHENELADLKLDVMDHSDNLMSLVE